MCYPKPGPRCSSHAKKALIKATRTYRENPSEDTKKARNEAIAEFTMTPEGIKQLRQRGMSEAANANERKREAKIALYKSLNNEVEDSQTLAASVIPRNGQLKDYYAGTDAKHFHDKNKPGSKFTDPDVNNFNDLVALTARQRNEGLSGDDRESLITMGTNPSALKTGYRYLLVTTSGKLGVKSSATIFDGSTKVRVERTKAGASCSLVMDVHEQDTVDFGVVVMGRPDGFDDDIAITGHPGLPSTSSGRGTFDEYEGKEITVDQARRIAGTDEVNINTRLVEE